MSPDNFTKTENLRITNGSSDGLPVSALAFLGDGVWEIMVREYLTVSEKCKANRLHEKNIEMVKASFQADSAKTLLPFLDEDELKMFTRGRNTHTAHTPRGTSKGDYHAATGLEVLFGWLYTENRFKRLKDLFYIVLNEVEK